MALGLEYTVFAIQDGGQCFGSSTAQNTYSKYGTSSECSGGKGGPLANDVYRMQNGEYMRHQPSWKSNNFNQFSGTDLS